MSQPLPQLLTDLPRDETLRIADGNAHVIAVFEGQVWLTQDGDPRDIILEAGESFTFHTPGVTLVQAFRDARVLVSNPAALDTTRAIDSQQLHRKARALRDAAVKELIVRGLTAAESAVRRASQRLAARVSASHRSLRASSVRV